MTDPNTKYVTVRHEVPRDPDAYDYTSHAEQRRRYRRDPKPKEWIIDEVIQEGRCAGQDVSSGDDSTDVFRFEKTVWSEGGDHDWTVVVAIDPEAFTAPDRRHRVVSVYCPCHDDDLPDCEGAATTEGIAT